MTNTNLLKEAIADAKAVKETAIANAKLALEEAFTPHLKSMLSAKLQEMDDDIDEGEKEEVQEMDDVSWKLKNGDSLDLAPRKVGQSTVNEEEDMDEELDLNELLAELELGEDARTDAEEEGYLDGEEDEKEDMEGEMDDEEIDLEDMSEDDLKGFIESVIKDMVAAGEIEPGDDFEGESENEEDVEIEIAEMSNPVMRDGDKGDNKAEKETEKMRFKESEDDSDKIDEYGSSTMREPSDAAAAGLENIISGLKKLIAKGGPIAAKAKALLLDLGAGAGAALRSEGENAELDEYGSSTMREPSDAAAAGLDNIISSLKKLVAKGGPIAAKAKALLLDLGAGAGAALRSEAETEELDEIEALKKELNEVNLLNAKLLYTNKIFRAKNLSESKKVTVLKAFDNAKDVKQAKTIFETLNAGLIDKTVNETIKRGSASQATGLEPKTVQQPIIESNDIYNRMRQLAGLL
jgi:hypothetical protein